MSDIVTELAGNLVSAIAAKEGVAVDAAALAQKAAELVAELVTGRVKQQAQADADAAAEKIQTLQQAEDFERRPG